MPSNNSAAPCLSSGSLAAACESYGVDSRLLYNDIEQLSKKRFDYAQRLILWSRLLSAASMVAAGATGVAVYYHQAQIYRVWRLRNPRKVQRLVRFAMLSGGFCLCNVLFLISPVGLMRLHENELCRTKQLDAIAVAALVQEQNFRTVAAWTHAAADAGRLVPAPSSSAVPPSPAGAATNPMERGREGEGGVGPEPQWVWREVVLDPTQLLQLPCERTTQHNQRAAPVDKATTDTDADMLAVKKLLSSQLLVNSESCTDAGRGGSEANSAAESPTWRQQPRRVWSRTADPAELQQLKDECVAMWVGLVAEKTAILQKVL
ncbi:conserved hypothetical protein [Leishmania mexicana MHOM/GT/2001/U1103]|uniref:Transmembrane protein n=1 Tax=Leishmania mexicana (strain MHOM/GT/2001/U1103) TaxID=929439 RepID=E9ANW4_LEIMU|nr:conserved hypothetical protein [Leishmania mexicana MHOM/GT/2001/U1103]CBZ24628.1 conserved hypothetical protein [Leishmania mexicana MHOM/GT/2001/U1103]